ncbi:Sec63-domain-containing protein [Wallemia mellicola]|uniref:Histone acetyltransferase type B catalytic subunit n=1 Tax=Wallemia mellicola TaxID=1708541 RepID=A0AB74KJ32_9BASI|nr:hypothetical protein E3Q24_01809 [Wallemia mellicola]TIB86154.1 Sec63-domain-containing protein [Wallemia mellicola]TIB89291.1 Sec63-domain-containing protein [Wallemia mellicola]TIC41196.1 Sec63-domain-containing protein [Wallemia mellicola]TIC49803.1 Sec63-domain-containing protein [Wallemia mellicola]
MIDELESFIDSLIGAVAVEDRSFPSLVTEDASILPERSSYAIDGDSRNLVTELLQDRQNSINDHNKPSNEGPSGSNATTNALNDLLKFVNSTFADAELHDKIINEVSSLLTSSRSTDDISSALVDTLGFDAFDVISIVLANRAELARVLADVVAMNTQNAEQHTKAFKREKGRLNNDIEAITPEEARRRKEEERQANAKRPLFSNEGGMVEEPNYPHVYKNAANGGNILSAMGSRYLLPLGTTKDHFDNYDEITIPPSKPIPPKLHERIVDIGEMDALCQRSFKGYEKLNRVQSVVYPTAYTTNENMLVCAPTGAGKTDVAMLTILRVVSQFADENKLTNGPGKGKGSSSFGVRLDDFKIIYVAPMKALAAEITAKLSKRLSWLDIKVRELTGDMQLTKAEINATQIIVTTPEKWDVVTRKPTGEGDLASKVKLLIIDEVHLLNEDRGAVIETIVARTLRQVEATQSLIRIVGLSATLPNYVDVADFLRVSRYKGLFYFDGSFRPIPLEQHFIGVKGKPGSSQSKKNLDQAAYEKAIELVEQGHSVMVFVHARKETVKTAETLMEFAKKDNQLDSFDCSEHPRYHVYKRDIAQSRNREMKQLFDKGFGIHHAGMLRSDRSMMEKMFEDGAIKILCCTSTLAWGVNLPAHAVIIKGTQVYDSNKGAFSDLSILDVLQIFGRSGRPGYSTSGVAWLCTSYEKLDDYIQAVLSSHPIESKFHTGIVDALNAEISLGSVSNVSEAIQWLSFTYMFVRMRKNPLMYGMDHDEPLNDPLLGNKRNMLIMSAARQLAQAKMVTFDENEMVFESDDLGKIASKFYICHESISIYNKELTQTMSEADILGVLCQSVEFDQIQMRDSEVPELKHLMEDICPCQVKGGTDTSQGKCNILLQAYISRAYIDDFALVSDCNYVAQNGARLIRALLEISLSHKWAVTAASLISMSKALEQRLWPYEHPMKQQFGLRNEVIYNITRWADESTIEELVELSPAELGTLIHLNESHGAALHRVLKSFPTLSLHVHLKPLSHEVLKLQIQVTPNFTWNEKISGSLETFFLIAESEDELDILQWSNVQIRPTTEEVNVDFILRIDGSKQIDFINIRTASDRWLGSEDLVSVSLENLVMPAPPNPSTKLIDLPFLSTSSLSNLKLESAMNNIGVRNFNSIQTQCFESFYAYTENILLCAPVYSGKSTLSQLAIWRAFTMQRNTRTLILTPSTALTRETAHVITTKFSKAMSVNVVNLTSDPEQRKSHLKQNRVVFVCSAEVLMKILQSGQTDELVNDLSTIVADDLHLLNSTYELSLSLLKLKASTSRYVGISASLDNFEDLRKWLSVDPALAYNFTPQHRNLAISTSIQTHSVTPMSAFMKALVKPTYSLIKSASKGAILFVPTRTQCRSVASDLITLSATDSDLIGLATEESIALEPYLDRLSDKSLAGYLLNGIGVYYTGLPVEDLALTLELFVTGILRALIAPRDMCWSMPVRASSVCVLNTQYLTTKSKTPVGDRDKVDKQIQEYSLPEVAHMQAYASVDIEGDTDASREFVVMAHENGNKELYAYFLNSGLPLESRLMEDDVLLDYVGYERQAGRLNELQEMYRPAGISRPTAKSRSHKLEPGILNKLLPKVDCSATPEEIYSKTRQQVKKSKQSLFDLHIALESSSPAIVAAYNVAEDAGFYYDPSYSTSKPGLKGSDTFYTTGSTLDHVLSEPTSEDPPIIIHYADPTAENFKSFFDYFIKRSKRLQYILRWAPTRDHSFRPQKLSGWGVKMDLKKREYLSHDDRVNAEKINNIQTNVASDMSDEEYGVLQPFLKEAFTKPLQTIETKEDIRSLSGNLIALLQKSDNPLGLLTAITQNLPLLAPQLAETDLDGSNDILKELSYNQEKYIEAGQNAVWLNGRRLYDVDIEPFSLLRQLENENKLIDSISTLGFSKSDAIKLLNHRALYAAQVTRPDSIAEGLVDASDRIEGGDVVRWINDLEKDEQYRNKSWSPYLRSLLSPLGRVARNYINCVLVVDLSKNEAIEMLSRNVRAFIDRGIPVRWGVTPYINSLNDDNIAIRTGTFAERAEAAYLDLPILNDVPLQDEFDTVMEDMAKNKILKKAQKYARRLGVSPGEHEIDFIGEIFVNGRPIMFDDRLILSLQEHISAQTDAITKAVYKAEIDERSDVSLYFYDKPSTLKRRNKYLQPSSKIMNYVHSESDFFETTFVVPDTPERIDVTIWLVSDFNKPESMELIKHALSGMIVSPTFRLGFFHNPSELETPTGSISQTIKGLPERVSPLEFFEALQDRGEIPEDAEGMEGASEWIYETDIEPGESGLIVNGRVIGPIPPNGLEEEDYSHLFQYDYAERVLPIVTALEEIAPHRLKGNVDDVANLLTQLGSQLWKNIQNEQPEGIYEPPHTPRARVLERLHSKHTSIRLGKELSSQYSLDVILDPFSEQGQKWSKILHAIAEAGDTYIRIVFNPNLDSDKIAANRFYRFNMHAKPRFDENGHVIDYATKFSQMPVDALFTLELDPPQAWLTRPVYAPVDLDNLNLATAPYKNLNAIYQLDKLVVDGHARDSRTSLPPRGLQLSLKDTTIDTQVVANLGYLQLAVVPGRWELEIREGRGRDVYELESIGSAGWNSPSVKEGLKDFIVDSFEGVKLYPRFLKKPGMEGIDVLSEQHEDGLLPFVKQSITSLKSFFGLRSKSEHADINIFTVASGLLYERFASIMILSVLKHTDHTVKFWFIENFLSPSFIEFLPHLAKEYNFKYELVTYKWPSWLRPQKERQRMLWAYKILFLDVLFPMSLDKIIFVDADNIVRTDLKELIDVDLHGRAYGYPPIGMDRQEMDGYRFWTRGYWKDYLRGRNYHISALYVVDLKRFRQMAAGDRLRGQYQGLSADPGSLANLDQDLPNNFQTEVPIHSLDKSWLWCQTWNSDESLADAKTIDLCNNPMTKEPKLERARKIPEWTDYDGDIQDFSAKLASEKLIKSLLVTETEDLAQGPKVTWEEKTEEGDIKNNHLKDEFESTIVVLPNGSTLDVYQTSAKDALHELSTIQMALPWVKVIRKYWLLGKLWDAEIICSRATEVFQRDAVSISKFATLKGNIYLDLARNAPKLVLNNAKHDRLSHDIKSRKEYLTAAATQFVQADKALQSEGETPRINSPLYLGKASLQLAQGNLDAALSTFNSILKGYSRNVFALMGKARVLHVKRHYAEALRVYQEVLRISPNLMPDPRIGIGLCFWQLNCPKEAQAAWKRSSHLNPTLYAPQLLLGLLNINEAKKPNEPDHYRMKSYSKGIQYVHTAYKLNEYNSNAANVLAYYFLGKRKMPTAIRYAERAIQYADAIPVLVDAHNNLGRVHHYNKNTEDALRCYKVALERSPNNIIAQLGRGQLLLTDETLMQAVHHFDKLVQGQTQKGSPMPEALLILATLRSKVLPGISTSELHKNRESARDLFDRFLKLVMKGSTEEGSLRGLGNEAETFIELAKIWEKDNLQKSSEAYERAYTLRSQQGLSIPIEMLNNVAVLTARRGNVANAKAYLLQAVERLTNGESNTPDFRIKKVNIEQHSCTIKYNLGRLLEDMGDHQEARRLYNEVLIEHPEYFECKYDVSSAKRFCDDTLKKIAPNDVYALCVSGWITYIKSRDMRVKTGTSEAKDRERQFREAIIYWEKALRYDPRCVYAAQGLAIAIAENVVPDSSRRDKEEPSEEDNAKSRREALSIFTKIRDSLDEACVYINMGHCFYAQDEFDKAVEVYEHGLSKNEDTITLLHACRANYSKGVQRSEFHYLEKSLTLAQTASVKAPKDKSIKYNIAMIEQKMLQVVLDTPSDKRSLQDLQKAIDLSVESQELFGKLAAEDPATVPFSVDLAEQRQAFGEGLVVRGPSEIEKQKVFEAERHERTEKSRREKEAALQKAKEDEAHRLEMIKKRSEELAEKRKQAHEDIKNLRETLKAEEEAEEKSKTEKKSKQKRKETEDGNESDENEPVKKPKRKTNKKKKLRRKQGSDGEDDGAKQESQPLSEAEGENEGEEEKPKTTKSKSRKRRTSTAENDDADRKKVKTRIELDENLLESEEELRLTRPWNPEFTYPIFGTEEQIYGYKNLRINLDMASGSLRSQLRVSHEGKKDDADNVEDKLEEFIPLEKGDFDSIVKDDAKEFRPPGELVTSYTRNSAKSEGKGKGKRRRVETSNGSITGEEGDVVYEIYRSSWQTAGWKDFNRRMQFFLLLFIEAANYLDEDDDNWEFFTLFERRCREDGSYAYHFVGYSSLYSFYHFPTGHRQRLSQFLILPPYQRQGHASELYNSIRSDVLSRQDVIELGVEDPSEAFDILRDINDLRWLNEMKLLENKTALDIDRQWIEQERKKLKVARRQFLRLIEMLLLHKLDPKNQEQLKRFRLLVKDRLYRFNYEQLIDLTPEERKAALQLTYEGVIDNYRDIILKSHV